MTDQIFVIPAKAEMKEIFKPLSICAANTREPMSSFFLLTTTSANGGYIALMSAIVISLLLILLSVTLSFTGFFARFNVLAAEYKERSLGLAEACSDLALIKLAVNPAYAPPPGGEIQTVGSDTCRILSVERNIPVAGQLTVRTQGIFPASGAERSYANLQVAANSLDLSLVSWQEVPSYP